MDKGRKKQDERKKAQTICPEDYVFQPLNELKQKEQSIGMAKFSLHNQTTILAEAYNTKRCMLLWTYISNINTNIYIYC